MSRDRQWNNRTQEDCLGSQSVSENGTLLAWVNTPSKSQFEAPWSHLQYLGLGSKTWNWGGRGLQISAQPEKGVFNNWKCLTLELATSAGGEFPKPVGVFYIKPWWPCFRTDLLESHESLKMYYIPKFGACMIVIRELILQSTEPFQKKKKKRLRVLFQIYFMYRHTSEIFWVR